MNLNMRPKNLHFLAAGSILFLGFFTLLVLETQDIFLAFDPVATTFLQTAIPRSWDQFLSLFTLLGSFEITALVVVFYAGWVFRQKKIILYSLLFFGFLLVFELFGKYFLVHPGPPANLVRYDLPFHLIESPFPTKYSFPSGHVSRTLFVTIVGIFLSHRLITVKPKKILAVSLFILEAIFIIISRVYLGEHWASDVFGGIFLGSAMGFFTLVYY